MSIKSLPLAVVLFLTASIAGYTQSDSTAKDNAKSEGQLHGNFQILWQQYNADSTINTVVPPPKSAMNAFGNFIYTKGHFSAGVRFESYQDAVLGFSPNGRFKGSGIGNRYARYNNDGFDITVGNFYEQFGSGMTLRSYWEPNLGIDNALDGVRVIYNKVKGLQVKMVYGQQRLAFDSKIVNADAIVRGIDGEIYLNDLLKGWAEKKAKITLGGSFVSRFQTGGEIQKDTLLLGLPQNVAAYNGRIQVIYKGFQFSGEYVRKINDPSADNAYIYHNGQGIYTNASYSRKGLGINLAAKSIDDMSFRSNRDLKLFDVPISYVPAITKQHTYNLASTLYPYATPFTGEASLMAEVFYTLKKGSLLGGKNGLYIGMNFAAANSLDTTHLKGVEGAVYGYKVNSLGFGPTKYIRDFNLEIKKKINKSLNFGLTYYYLEFNAEVTPVTNDFKGLIYANIGVAEVNYKFNPKNNLHVELQSLTTKQDKGDWATIVAEYSYSPHWVFGVVDQYNYGNPNDDNKTNYLFGTAGYINGATRVMVGYGRRRAGVFCIGGVCRAVPATNGFEVTITSSF